MELFASLEGNSKIKKTLAEDIYNGKQAHAYIIEGAKGSGKHTVAYLAAASLFCQNKSEECFPCGKCSACKKTFEKINTDITVISRDGRATLGVDSIRQIKETLKLAPVEMQHKVYIIEESDKMTKSAQNALLLSLEEPPEYVLFLLLCEDSSPILETVKSRAPVLRCESFSKEAIKEYLLNDKEFSKIARDDEKKFDEACAAASGSIGAAKLFLTPKLSKEIHDQRAQVISATRALCTGTTKERVESLSLYPSARIDISEFIKLEQRAIRDLLYIKKSRGNELLFFADTDSAAEISSRTSTRRLLKIQSSLRTAFCDINANLNCGAVLSLLVTK